jgi:hypothetical protein
MLQINPVSYERFLIDHSFSNVALILDRRQDGNITSEFLIRFTTKKSANDHNSFNIMNQNDYYLDLL